VVLETVDWLGARYRAVFDVVEWVSVAIFSVEYALRIWVADARVGPDRSARWSARARYCLGPSGLIDLLAIAPFYVSFFFPSVDLRFLRMFRLVRFLKLARYSPALGSLLQAIASEGRALIAALVIMLGLVLTAASALYLVEREVQPERFGTIPDAMWWAVATLTTVGYGDVIPVTSLGKVIGGLVMIFGLAMFALPIGIVATSFAQEIHRREFVVTWGMVAKVPLFSSLNASGIADVMRLLTARVAEAGEIIVREGDEAHSMYIIASGRVEVLLADDTVELSDGDVFGEIAVLRSSRRSATVRAIERSRLLALDAVDLQRLMDFEPTIAEQVWQVATERVGAENLTLDGDMTSKEISGHERGRQKT
jgi:voltage-gated potassium channel